MIKEKHKEIQEERECIVGLRTDLSDKTMKIQDMDKKNDQIKIWQQHNEYLIKKAEGLDSVYSELKHNYDQLLKESEQNAKKHDVQVQGLIE